MGSDLRGLIHLHVFSVLHAGAELFDSLPPMKAPAPRPDWPLDLHDPAQCSLGDSACPDMAASPKGRRRSGLVSRAGCVTIGPHEPG